MKAYWIAGVALTAIPIHASLDTGMVVGPRPDQAALKQACSEFEKNAEQSGWGRLKRVASLPEGKLDRLVLLTIGKCPAREVVKGGQVFLVQGQAIYQTAPRSDQE